MSNLIRLGLLGNAFGQSMAPAFHVRAGELVGLDAAVSAFGAFTGTMIDPERSRILELEMWERVRARHVHDDHVHDGRSPR